MALLAVQLIPERLILIFLDATMVVAKLRRGFKGNQETGTRGLISMRLRLRHNRNSKTNNEEANHPTITPKSLRPLALLRMRIPSLAESVVSELDPVTCSSSSSSRSSINVSEHHPTTTTTTTTQTRPRPSRIIKVISGELRSKIHQRVKFVELLLPGLSPVNILYALIFLAAVLWPQPLMILFYGALWILFQSVVNVVQKWFQFYAQDPEIIRCTRSVKFFLKRVLDESNKALNGNYARQVVAAYLIVSSTGPGESYIGKVIRYKMACINKQVVDQIDHSLRCWLHLSCCDATTTTTNNSPEDNQVNM